MSSRDLLIGAVLGIWLGVVLVALLIPNEGPPRPADEWACTSIRSLHSCQVWTRKAALP